MQVCLPKSTLGKQTWLAPEQTFLMKDTYAKDRQFVCRVLFQNNTA